jgi:hypothetical protein
MKSKDVQKLPITARLFKLLRENGALLKKVGAVTGGSGVIFGLGYTDAVYRISIDVEGMFSVAKLVFCNGSML